MMTAKCTCVAVILEVLPVCDIARLVSSYIPHLSDKEVIRRRLALGTREWVVKANDDFILKKDRDRRTGKKSATSSLYAFNSTRQEVILKIRISDIPQDGIVNRIMFDLEETCNQYHSHTIYSVLMDTCTYDPKEVLMKQWEQEFVLKYSSPLFARMIERVCVVMNERILAILAVADRHREVSGFCHS